MPLIPDAKWLEAFKLPLRVMIGLALACYVLLWLDYTKHIELSIFGNLTKPSVFVLTVVASALAVSGIGAGAYEIFIAKHKRAALAERKEAQKKEAEELSIAKKAAALDRLNYLSPEELRYLADCLRKGNQSFTTWVHSSYASTLAAKGLIYTPGGTHHQDHYPFTIADFAWSELLRRKDEFIARDDENKKKQERPRRGVS
jgi:hypothetical protein